MTGPERSDSHSTPVGPVLMPGRRERCRVCDGPTSLSLEAVDRRATTQSTTFGYVECVDCGCLQIATLPEDLARYYPADYYAERQRVPAGRGGGVLGWRRSWTRFRLGSGWLRRLCSGRRYARFDWLRLTQTGVDDPILDVGCGSGRLLWRLHRDGFRQLFGIDEFSTPRSRPDRPGPRFARQALERHTGQYRLVMAHHSFEHARDPRQGFEALASLVAPGGRLLLRLPLADSWARRHYGADWAQLDAPRHLHLHTRRSIEILAARSGFRVARVVDDSGAFQILGSERIRRSGRPDPPRRGLRERFARLLVRRRARRLSRRGLGDQACFYLEPIGEPILQPIPPPGLRAVP